jgi:predicted RNA binding protein YcfA (HicA-like mRNA interferase family)
MSPIDYSKLRGLTARKPISALQRDGFIFSRQSGSHQVYYHPDGSVDIRGSRMLKHPAQQVKAR